MVSPAQRFSWIVGVVLALSLGYAILEVGFVRPYLPTTEIVPVVARAPRDDVHQLDSWRDTYRSAVKLSGEPVWRSAEKADWARRHLGMTVQVLIFTLGALVLMALRSGDLTAGLSVL